MNVLVHWLLSFLVSQCGNESARVDAYLDIPLVIRPFGSTETYDTVVSEGFSYVIEVKGLF